MGYIHVEININQFSKYPGGFCGDYCSYFRTSEATVIILVDGLGSGAKAGIYANLAASRIQGLLKNGRSLRSAFLALCDTMHRYRGTKEPYSVFTLAQILRNGETTILSYEMPRGIFLAENSASEFHTREVLLGSEVISETNLFLESGEGLLIFSDGISHAGIGGKTVRGWNGSSIARFATDCLFDRLRMDEVGTSVFNKALRLWGKTPGDDCTLVSAFCREGKVVDLMTGPPLNREKDREVIRSFCKEKGFKVVCGATTASIVARETGKQMSLNANDKSLVAPPGYSIENIDLVTEGAVTLNQVFNILDAEKHEFESDSSVSRLCKTLQEADRINFYIGNARNESHENIAFRQRGILPRKTIIKLLSQRLEEMGKLIDICFI